MTGTELAINLGFIVTKEGRVFLKDKEYASKFYGKRSLSFYFRNNNKKYQARRKYYENNNKEYIKNIKNCGCAICDEKDIACLDFHHLRDKEFNIANEIKNLSIDNLKKEIDKCIVLCANCHRKLHYYNLSIEELKRLHSVPEVA